MKKIALLILVTFLTSCDYLMIWDYSIVNHSGDTIIVELSSNEPHNVENHNKQSFDTIFTVLPDSTIVLCEKGRLGGVVSDFENCDSISPFNYLFVKKKDSTWLDENFLLRNKWQYSETHKRFGNYYLIITKNK
jgi:hypothetical protein